MSQIDESSPPPPLEHLSVRGLAGLRDVALDLRRVTVFVGPQGSGKSVVARLLHVLRGLPLRVQRRLLAGKSRADALADEAREFDRWFPPALRGATPASAVRFQSGRFEVEITGLSGEVAFRFGAGAEALFEAAEAAAGAVRAHLERLLAVGAGASPALLEAEAVQTVHWGLQRERRADFPVFALGERMFAPAGRGALALLDFSPAAGDGAGLDPAVLEFARQYLGMRRAAAVMQPAPREDDAVDRLLGGRLVLRDNRLRVVHPDHREVDLARASSGQQELAPLIVSLGLDREFPIREWGHVTVEEPESHIHPPAQQALVRLLVERFAGSASVTRGLLLTTHSPYVVTTLNNLAEAGAVEKALWEAVGQPAARARLDHPTFELVAGARGRADLGRHYLGLDAVVPPEQRIPVGDFAAVHFEGGDARDIIDPETGLAVAQTIDDVSQSIMEHFSALSELGAAVLDAARDTDGNR